MDKVTKNSIGFLNELSFVNVQEILMFGFGEQATGKMGLAKNKWPGDVKNLKEKKMLLTEEEMNEIEFEISFRKENAMRYEEVVKEVDVLGSGIKSSRSDIVEIQKRSDRCKIEIEEQENSYLELEKPARSIKTQSKSLSKN